MRTIILMALAIFGASILTGCEHEHWEHHRGGYGHPAPYDYGRGGYYHGPYYDHR